MLLYIDPGTGSMLFTILIGVISASLYGLKNLFMKLKFVLSGGKQGVSQNEIEYAIFADSGRYWNNFKSICDEFEKREIKAVYMTASSDDPALNEDYKFVKCEFIGSGNKAFAKLNMLKADILLSTTPGLDVYQWKRSRDVKKYVHIFHAPNDSTLYRMFGIDYYDSVLFSGEFQIEQINKLEQLRNLPCKDKRIVGMPYLDALYERKKSTPEPVKDKKVVLVAPSWGPSAILSKYGAAFIDALIETGYDVIIRPHPQSFTSEKEMIDKLMKAYPDGEKVQWNRDRDNFDVLNRSDILISDFSGVMFDFALVFDKPVICANASFDKSPYDAWWLDEELWTFSVLPSLGMQLSEDSISNIKSVIDECLEDTRYEQGRKIAREQAWANIGNSAKATVDYLVELKQNLEK